MSRIGLQLVLGISAAVALLTGAWALKEGVLDPSWGLGPLTPTPGLVLLDTTFRFVNGIWLGLGVVFVALIPRIERRGEALAVAVTLIFLGGVGRLFSMAQLGMPHPALVVATVVELLYPLLVPWQRAVAAAFRARASGGRAAAPAAS